MQHRPIAPDLGGITRHLPSSAFHRIKTVRTKLVPVERSGFGTKTSAKDSPPIADSVTVVQFLKSDEYSTFHLDPGFASIFNIMPSSLNPRTLNSAFEVDSGEPLWNKIASFAHLRQTPSNHRAE